MLFQIAIKCCSMAGMVLDTNQITCKENFEFGMNHLSEERSYYPIDFASIFVNNNRKEMQVSTPIIHNFIVLTL